MSTQIVPEAIQSNTNIPSTAMPAYRQFIYRQSQAFLESVDEWLSNHEVSDADAAKTPVQRIGLGMYWIQSGAGGKSK